MEFYQVIRIFAEDGYFSHEKIPFEMKDSESFCFDDATKSKPTKMPLLYKPRKAIQNTGNMTVIKGGLFKPDNLPTYQADDLISDEFKKWQREQKDNQKQS